MGSADDYYRGLDLFRSPINTRELYGYICEAKFDEKVKAPCSTGWWVKTAGNPKAFYWRERPYIDDVGRSFAFRVRKWGFKLLRDSKGHKMYDNMKKYERPPHVRDERDYDEALHLEGIGVLDRLGALGDANKTEPWCMDTITHRGWADLDRVFPWGVVDVKFRAHIENGVKVNETTINAAKKVGDLFLPYHLYVIGWEGKRPAPKELERDFPRFRRLILDLDDLPDWETMEETGRVGQREKRFVTFPWEMFEAVG